MVSSPSLTRVVTLRGQVEKQHGEKPYFIDRASRAAVGVGVGRTVGSGVGVGSGEPVGCGVEVDIGLGDGVPVEIGATHAVPPGPLQLTVPTAAPTARSER